MHIIIHKSRCNFILLFFVLSMEFVLINMIKMRSFEITWHILLLYNQSYIYIAPCVQHFLYVTLFYGPEQDLCRGCLPLLIAVYRLLDFDQMWLESKDNRNYKEKKKEIYKNGHFDIWGPNLKRAETSGPNPLGVKSEKGRNLWQPPG